MAVTVDQLQTHLEAARTSLGSEDYASAEKSALQAMACLAALPDGEQTGDRVHWRDTINELLNQIRTSKREAAATDAGGIQRTLQNYVAPTT